MFKADIHGKPLLRMNLTLSGEQIILGKHPKYFNYLLDSFYKGPHHVDMIEKSGYRFQAIKTSAEVLKTSQTMKVQASKE